MDFKGKYYKKVIREYPAEVNFLGARYEKEEELRYGTNPHQGSALYKKKGAEGVLKYEVLKVGKEGLSQSNIEDMNYGMKIIKYMEGKSCVMMKHLNPCGVSMARGGGEDLKEIYRRTRRVDEGASFGGVVIFNDLVSCDLGEELMRNVIEMVVAPGYEEGVLEIFKNVGRHGKNKHLRVIEVGGMEGLKRYEGEGSYEEVKVLEDGRIVVSESYLTRVRSERDLKEAVTWGGGRGEVRIERKASRREYEDLLFAWYVNIGVRSNGIVIAKNRTTLGIGTGEQDRIGAVLQAIEKAKHKYKGKEELEGAVLSSDGFFPFCDAIERIGECGIKAIVQPGGSIQDYEIIQKCNEYKISMVFTDERCFSHH